MPLLYVSGVATADIDYDRTQKTHTARAPHVSIFIMGYGGWPLGRNVIPPSPSVGMRNDEGHKASAPKLHAGMISGDWVVMRGGVTRE